MGSPIQVLSAGAVKTGVRAAADAYAAQAGAVVATRFATAPAIRSQVAEGAAADVVIVPPAAMSDFSRLGRIEDATRITLGRVGAGIAIREGAEAPDISSAKAIEQALHAADSIAYNKASTGIYIDSLFERLGIAQALAGKIARQDNGAAVMNHLLQSPGRAIGFGAITEILVFKDKGVRLVGPLPPEIQNFTTYDAAVMKSTGEPSGARALVAFLASSAGRTLLRECGIEGD